jgi:hypothetical protein
MRANTSHLYLSAAAVFAVLLAAQTATAQTIPCKTDRDCPDKGLCMTGKCQIPTPKPEPQPPAPTPAPTAPTPECTADSDCTGANTACQGGKCVTTPAPAPAPSPAPGPMVPGCASDKDCPGEQVCIQGGCGAPPSEPEAVGCVRDVDCKGDRICVSGECVEPTDAYKQPKLQQYKDIPMTGEPNWFQGYLQVSGVLQIASWGGWTSNNPTEEETSPEGEISANIWGGIHVAAYYAPVEIVQVGAFFMFTTGDVEVKEDQKLFPAIEDSGKINTFGVTIKVGGRPTGHVWVGGALDVGYAMWDFENFLFESKDFRADSVLIFPRVAVDILAVDSSGFKLAFPLSVGAIITPYAYGEFSVPGIDPKAEIEPWVISPAVTLGIALGGGRPTEM